jgi:hypothetical protein
VELETPVLHALEAAAPARVAATSTTSSRRRRQRGRLFSRQMTELEDDIDTKRGLLSDVTRTNWGE